MSMSTEINADGDCQTAVDVMELLMGFQKSQVMFTATSLGLFDELNRCPSPTSAGALASSLGLHPDSTERLLNACVAISLVVKSFDDNGQALYHNSPSAEKFLVSSNPTSLVPHMMFYDGAMYPLFGQLKNGVRQGTKQIGVVAQTDSNETYDVGTGFYVTNDKMLTYHRFLHTLVMLDVDYVIKAFDLGEFHSACDAGGGTGALGSALARAYPKMDVKVIDLEHVGPVFHHFHSDQKPSNLFFEGKDFFKDELPKSDLYLLCRVAHTWDDDHLRVLLSNIFKSLNPGGALLIAEKVLNETKDGPLLTILVDLIMLASTGGKERTVAEHTSLLEEHGFVDVQARLLPESFWSDVIFARKPRKIGDN